MIDSVIVTIITLIEGLLPAITSQANVGMIDNILNALTSMLPFIIQEIQTLVTPVKNIIAALSANPATTAQQLSSLQALDAQVDAAFEAAAVDTDAGVGS